MKWLYCWLLGGHIWVTKTKNHGDVEYYKIVCERCNKGEQDGWKRNRVLFMVKY